MQFLNLGVRTFKKLILIDPTPVAPTAVYEKKPCFQLPVSRTRSFSVNTPRTSLHILGLTDIRVPGKNNTR